MKAVVLMLLAFICLALVHVGVARSESKDVDIKHNKAFVESKHHGDMEEDDDELEEGLIPVEDVKKAKMEANNTPKGKHGKNKGKKRRKHMIREEKQQGPQKKEKMEKRMKAKEERRKLRKEKRKERKEKKQAKKNKRKMECTVDSDCNGSCCIKKKNRKVCSKPFNRDVNSKCKRSCQCEQGLECFVRNKKSAGKNRKMVGSCVTPKDGDLDSGYFLNSL